MTLINTLLCYERQVYSDMHWFFNEFQVLHIILAPPVTRPAFKDNKPSPQLWHHIHYLDMLNMTVNLKSYAMLHQPIKTLHVYSLI